jgi:hypothetical protein
MPYHVFFATFWLSTAKDNLDKEAISMPKALALFSFCYLSSWRQKSYSRGDLKSLI